MIDMLLSVYYGKRTLAVQRSGFQGPKAHGYAPKAICRLLENIKRMQLKFEGEPYQNVVFSTYLIIL